MNSNDDLIAGLRRELSEKKVRLADSEDDIRRQRIECHGLESAIYFIEGRRTPADSYRHFKDRSKIATPERRKIPSTVDTEDSTPVHA